MERMEETQRFLQLKNLATSVISCWSILAVPVEEKLDFMPLLHYAKAGSVDDIPENFAPTEDFMKIVENECNRLQKIVIDLILRKKYKLQQIYQRSHLECPFSEEGSSDVKTAFEQVKKQISIAKVVSMDRQDIVTRVELLQRACAEIQWYVSPDNASSIEDHQRVTRGKMLVDFFPQMLEDLEDKVDVRQRIEAMQALYEESTVGIDILHQLVVPRQLRTRRIPVQVNVPPSPPQPQVSPPPPPPQPQVLPPQQLVVPRQPRTLRIPVQLNVPPAPQPQVPPPPPPQPQVLPQVPPSQPSDDDSMASSGSKSDSKDSDYHPSGSDASE